MEKKTDWYPCSVNPVRVGYYEWSKYGDKKAALHYWDGANWRWVKGCDVAFYNQALGFWRGLAEGRKG